MTFDIDAFPTKNSKKEKKANTYPRKALGIHQNNMINMRRSPHALLYHKKDEAGFWEN